jgi:Xaa-Pro aminopeptidase
LITHDQAKLWTDGRYFLQAETQLAGSGIDLMKIGEAGVPEIPAYVDSVLSPGDCLGFDGRVVDFLVGRKYGEKYTLRTDLDLVGEIWPDRPSISPSKIYPLAESVTGEPAASKLARLQKVLRQKGADYHLMTKLEEIAWLFNLRGRDIANTPVFFAFALVTPTGGRLYVLDPSLADAARKMAGIQVLPYLQIFEDLKTLPSGTMLLDAHTVSYALATALPRRVQIIDEQNPVALMKALKNPVEIASTRDAHIKDGVAMVNFLHWLKSDNRINRNQPITEISAADYLEQCRRREGCFDLSFDTIAGYQDHGAIIHYSATPETDRRLEPEGFLLVDSGGQYPGGTTDITRTIALGPLTEEMKRHYTLVLRSHIALATAKFSAGTTGAELDTIARRPLREAGMDFNHGTGHGVGHLLSVHEGPQNISPRGGNCALQPGMITSNEPGYYLEGHYGIRLENEILCVAYDDGFYGFETITFCPFERDAILPELLSDKELAWLNDYHRKVYKKLCPYLDTAQNTWLRKATAEI